MAGGKEGRRYPDRPIVGVLAVVLRDERALVVRRSNPPLAGRWGFPGGVLEFGETVAEGAMRELVEETGVVAEPSGVSGRSRPSRHASARRLRRATRASRSPA